MMDDQLAPLARPRSLDPYSSSAPHLAAIVDTNVLLSSVDNDCRNAAQGRRSRLLLMSDCGDIVLYAADHVLDEMYEHLPTIAKSSPVPLATLRAYFEAEYLPVLRFVTVSETDAPDSQVLAITDPDDVPTGRLAKLITPCVVFSDDIHLKRPGFAPRRWLDMAKAAVDFTDGHQGQVTLMNAAALPLRGVAGLLSFAGRKVNVSPWILGGLVLGAGALLLQKPERRKAAAEVANKIFEGVSYEFAGAMTKERQGVEQLRKVVLAAPSQPTLRQRIAIVLARQSEPLLAAEVHNLIQERFPEAPNASIRDVRCALEAGTEFVRVQRYRWQLGREVEPRSL
ncbi:hypothetical protein GA0115240_144896 [Streptomyces sp. DvalAA-14]|uniref:hypothetical protein n=1 Tax=unclassified Streptomyces TaxID=2593676 RepID=UPI00081AFC22|nr:MULTISPECIES: hypothetical protein [unclassified Streptomyces]MYS22837.1 hypothetical protein [Streptomyces sp. SID4948]SCE23038.1 hypothetical protein GA0115240_144896 [Streptomyces sp. DvalAA-14]